MRLIGWVLILVPVMFVTFIIIFMFMSEPSSRAAILICVGVFLVGALGGKILEKN